MGHILPGAIMNSSRFTRQKAPTDEGSVSPTNETPVRQAAAASPAPIPSATHSHGDNAALFAQLQERLTKVQQQRMRREVELNAATKAIQECQEAAQKIGISSLEELEAYVTKLEEEDAKALEEFMEQLDAEETLLASIEQQLADLERN